MIIIKNDYILLLDLDGTIITETIHFHIYQKLLYEHNIKFMYENYLHATNYSNIKDYVCNNYKLDNKIIEKLIIKKRKEIVKSNYPIELIDGFSTFLEILLKKNINFVVVTNSPISYVNKVKKTLPILNKITQWITREDYKNPKPNKESYEVAMKKYGNNEKYVIGFENSINGINSLSQVTHFIYGCIKDFNLEEHDIFLYKSYCDIINNIFVVK